MSGIASQDLVEGSPIRQYRLFDFNIVSPQIDAYMKTLGKSVMAVSIGSGVPPNEISSISSFVNRNLHYIGIDNNPDVVARGNTMASYYQAQQNLPLTTEFRQRDLAQELPAEEREIADIVMFNHPDVLGTQDEEYNGKPSSKWISIVKNGLSALKKGGITIAVTLQNPETELMKEYLRAENIKTIVFQNLGDVTFSEDSAIIIGIK